MSRVVRTMLGYEQGCRDHAGVVRTMLGCAMQCMLVVWDKG